VASRALRSAFVLLLAPTFLGAACEDWPLFAHLPEEEGPPPQPSRLTVTEDALPERTIQGIGTLLPLSIVTISGATDDCGFDESEDWPTWPDHPLDVDGDGVTDTQQPRFSGWFTGETDFFSLTSDVPVSVEIALTWTERPEGDFNAPYQPTEEDGAWASESDLDWVVFSVEDAAPDSVVSDAGFSTDYPQVGAQRLLLDPGRPLALSVACHHALPSAYSVVLDVRAR